MFNIRYSHRGKKYHVLVHRCIVAGLHVIRVRLFSQSASENHNQEKKSPQTFAHLMNFSKNVLAIVEVMYQALAQVFHRVSKHRERKLKNEA